MQSMPKNDFLRLPTNVLYEIRRIYNLHDLHRLNEAIDILEAWLKKQDHILKKDFGRDYLERTLISSKGSVEKAKKYLDRLCTMKTLIPHFFSKTNVQEELLEVLEVGWLVPLPTLTKDYYRILCMKLSNKGYLEKQILEYFQYNVILCEYIKAHDYVNGFVIIYDFQDTNVMDLVTKMANNFVWLQQYISILIEGYGARIKGVHIISATKAVDLLVKMVRQFINEKLARRIHVHKTLEELHMMVPNHLLPVEYGGKEKSIQKLREDYIEALSTKEHVEYMKIMNKAGTDEKLRRSEQFNQEYMGMPGSFRNLRVD